MKVALAYGRGRLTIDVPEQTSIITPEELPGLSDEHAAFEAPLRHLASSTSTVAIVIADITRPSPSERLVPWILAELAHVPRENVVIINGTGSHRANTREELVQMLGTEVVETVRIINHNAFEDATLTHMGRTSYGGEVWVNNEYVRADVRIATGFIE